MITIHQPIDFKPDYPLERLGELSELLFFDIETTGFSGDYSNLYLIGCTYFEDGCWQLVQWFADTAGSEPELLDAFFSHLARFKVLIHFNGDGFDIPYLMKRCRAFGLPYDFSGVKSIDIYKRIKPYKNMLNLDSLKQKSIEAFLGVKRKDMYSGGQLIEVYQDYLVTHDKFLYDLLLLHNEDDLKGMPLILPILGYCDFLEHEFTLTAQSVDQKRDLFGADCSIVKLTYESPYHIPVPISLSKPSASCYAKEYTIELEIPLYQGTLKYFYPNYKDYVYLIYEDTAVHKSVGEYVNKDAKKKATAQTCYTRKEGCFLPQFQPLWEPALKQEYKSKITYIEYRDDLLCDSCCCKYLSQVLEYLWK